MSAYGFIETLGLVGAIEAADAMTKAANVEIEQVSHVACGLVTLTVKGDLASVQSAVEAGRAAIQNVAGGTLVASNVIGNAACDMRVFADKKTSCCVSSPKGKRCC